MLQRILIVSKCIIAMKTGHQELLWKINRLINTEMLNNYIKIRKTTPRKMCSIFSLTKIVRSKQLMHPNYNKIQEIIMVNNLYLYKIMVRNMLKSICNYTLIQFTMEIYKNKKTIRLKIICFLT